MANVNQADHLIMMGKVKVEDLNPAVNVIEYPRQPLPRAGIGQRIALVIGKDVMERDPEAARQVMEELETTATKASVGDKTIAHTTERMASNTLKNLSHMVGVPIATNLHKPLRGVPAFLVAAGPSLDRNRHLLPECAKRGVIAAMNTSTGVLKKLGVKPDVVFSIESKDVAPTMRDGLPDDGSFDVLCQDVTCNPSIWDIPAKHRMMFANNDPTFSSTLLALGGVPTPYAGSVATTAASMLNYWSADPVVLLGQDLAWTDDLYDHSLWQRSYASDTLKAGIMHFRTPDNTITFVGHPDKDNQVLSVLDVPAWGRTGRVPTSYDLMGFIDWFGLVGKKCQNFVNATEGGAHLPDIPDVRLEDVLKTMSWHVALHGHRPSILEQVKVAPVITQKAVDDYKLKLQNQARAILNAACDYKWEPTTEKYFAKRMATDACMTIDAFVAASGKRARENEHWPMKARYNIIVEALIAGSRKMLELLG